MSNEMNRIRLLLPCTLIALAGCFSLGRDEPPQRHYVLGGTAVDQEGPRPESLAGLTVGLRRMQLAEYLETPFIVVRQGPHEIRLSEFNRWGEDLARGVNRAVAGYLTGRGPIGRVDVVPWPPHATHDYLIQLHLLRFEGLAPEASPTSEGEAHVLVEWEIVAPADGAVLSQGQTDVRTGGWEVGDYGELVTLLDAGLEELSNDLMAALVGVVVQ